jgi:thiol-disulfide isomerase/thioredoxin
LAGQVVLVDFWDYTCVNCLRTLPYLQRWHERYAGQGLQIIGIHAPEFRFARSAAQIEQAIEELRIPYPVLLDNEYRLWEQFANKAWPSKYLVDGDGYIRFRRQGEGHYQETERAIQLLLHQRNPYLTLPELLDPLREEDRAGALCYRPTPELYAGYQGGGFFGAALGNPEGYTSQGPVFYTLPPPATWAEGRFYLEGIWRAWPDALAFAGQSMGRVVLPYSAVTVNAVLSPSADPVETILDMRPTDADPLIEVRQNGRWLTAANAGADVAIQPDGRSMVRVVRPKMYELVRNPTYEPGELELIFCATGLALYAFTFTTCVAAEQSAVETFRVG